MRLAVTALLLALSACSTYRPEPLDPVGLLDELRTASVDVPAEGLTPAGAVALALVHNPDLQVWRRDHEIAATQVVSESAWANPELRLDLENLYSRDDDSFEWGFGLRLFPPVPGELDAKRARAEARERRVLARIEMEEGRIAYETRRAHAEIVSLDAQLAILQAGVQLHERAHGIARERVAAGAITRLDETMVLLRREELVNDAASLDAEREHARSELSRLIGLPVLTAYEVTPAPSPTIAPPATQEELERVALDRRADLRALAAAYQEEEQLLRLEHLAQVPWPRHVQPGLGGLPNHARMGLRLALEIPLVDTGDAEISIAAAGRDRARDAYRARLHGVRAEIRAALLRLHEQERRRRYLSERVTPVLRQAEELVRGALGAGAADVLALVAIESRVLDARRTAALADRDHEMARLDLAAATGSILVVE